MKPGFEITVLELGDQVTLRITNKQAAIFRKRNKVVVQQHGDNFTIEHRGPGNIRINSDHHGHELITYHADEAAEIRKCFGIPDSEIVRREKRHQARVAHGLPPY